MRIVKEHDERRTEILDTAERLFRARGYSRCTVNDILSEIGIAKGTFYHYFKSKEDVLDAVVSRYRAIVTERAERVLSREELAPEEKLVQSILCMRLQDEVDETMLDELHRSENALLHQKTLGEMVTAMAPMLVRAIDEGVAKGAWRCDHPLQYMQIFLAAALTLTDEGIFELEADEQRTVLVALGTLLEKMLEARAGMFLALFEKYWG